MAYGRVPGLVGDRDQVLRVMGRALTRIRNLLLLLRCCTQDLSKVSSCEWLWDLRTVNLLVLFYDIECEGKLKPDYG